MWTGIRSLLVFAAVLYLASWFALASGKKAAGSEELTPIGNTAG